MADDDDALLDKLRSASAHGHHRRLAVVRAMGAADHAAQR
jgi:hypothetical protein